MAIQNVPLTGADFIAALLQTALAVSKLRLIHGPFTPGPNDTLAALEALETTFSGYTSGGYSLTAWLPPAFNPVGGASITSPQINVAFVEPMSDPVTDVIAGWFLVDATGILIADGLFDTPVAMVANGDAFPISLAMLLGTVNALVQSWVYGNQQ